MHILLDTNTLLSFISDPNEEYLIDRLGILINSGQVELLVPETLMKEWYIKKDQKIKDKENLHERVSKNSHNKAFKDELKDELRILNEKIVRTEAILKKGIQLKLTDPIRILTAKRREDNLPPFKPGNKISFNDGLIFFTSQEFIKKAKITEYCFATKDRDFSDEQSQYELNPSLQVSGSIANYGPSLEKILRDLREASKIEYGDNSSSPNQGSLIWVLPEKDKTLLDHLYEVLVVCQQKMRMIPPTIFCRIHPFRIISRTHAYTYQSHYTLHTNNEKLLDLFSSVDFLKVQFNSTAAYTNTRSNVKKLRYIVGVLNQQFVCKISLLGSGKEIDIKPIKQTTCNCTRCLYSNLLWKDILAPNYQTDDPMKMAFANFQLGFYAKAFKGYYECYLKAKNDDNKIAAYQLQYTLKWIAHNIFSETDQVVIRIKKEVEEWDNEKQYFSFSQATALDQEIARFFQSGNLINSFSSDIKKHSDQILEHYHSQLRLFVSNNSNYWNLSTEFSTFIEFTIANGMVYTQYSDFLDICKDFTKGALLTYSLNEYQPTRLTALGDYEATSLFKYGDSNEMLKLYTRYIKKRLSFESEDGSFYKVVQNFLSNGSEVVLQMEKANAWQGSVQFYRMFWNLILLLAIVKFDKKFIRQCFDRIYPFIEVIPKRETHRLTHLASLIEVHGTILDKERIRKLFELCISNKEMHKDEIFDAFSDHAKKSQSFLIETKDEFDQFCELFLDKCPKCQNYHHNILFHGYEILTPDLQKELSLLIEQKLRAEPNFNLYYLSSIKNIIDHRLFFNDYLTLFKRPAKERQHPFSHLDAEIKFRELNNLMNLVFMNDICLPQDFIDKMKGASDYYDWLLDMKNFDYKKFNPLWINQYPTTYYMKKAFSFMRVRKSVRNYLKTNHQPLLAYYYSQYVM